MQVSEFQSQCMLFFPKPYVSVLVIKLIVIKQRTWNVYLYTYFVYNISLITLLHHMTYLDTCMQGS